MQWLNGAHLEVLERSGLCLPLSVLQECATWMYFVNFALLIGKKIAHLDCLYTMSSCFSSLLSQDDEGSAILK